MSYSDFLNQFVGVISLFINSLISVSESLMSNYIFITFLGITIFVSLFWFLHNIVMTFFENVVSGYEDYNNLYDDYVLKKQVQSDYLDNHYDDEFDYRYRSKLLNFQVLNGLYQTQHDLIVQNKIENLQANIDAIKGLKQINLLDNDDSNDKDVDMIIPNPPVNLVSFDELKQAELKSFHNELVKENNAEIDRILSEYSNSDSNDYIEKDGHIVNLYTGEVVSDNIINLGMFTYYDNDTKGMKKIALPIIPGENLQDFQFDNDRLSDFERDFISNHTLIREK